MNVAAALELLLQLAGTAGQVSALIARARADGRDEISEDDMASVVGADDAARARLVAAIEQAKAAGG